MQSNQQKKQLIILRGLPGSGKSTLANMLAGKNDKVFSIDDYFTNFETGEYLFDYRTNYKAYEQCLNNVQNAMNENVERIFVHNTFIKAEEMQPYFDAAQKHGYEIFVMTVENYHGKKNIHDIPNEQVMKMKEKYLIKLL